MWLLNKQKIEYLDYVSAYDKIMMDPSKSKVLPDWPVPHNVRMFQSFLGFTNFYHSFYRNFSEVAKPLMHCFKRMRNGNGPNVQFKRSNTFKTLLCSKPILVFLQTIEPFLVEADSSGYATGPVFPKCAMTINGIQLRISAKVFPQSECDYDIYDKRC